MTDCGELCGKEVGELWKLEEISGDYVHVNKLYILIQDYVIFLRNSSFVLINNILRLQFTNKWIQDHLVRVHTKEARINDYS